MSLLLDGHWNGVSLVVRLLSRVVCLLYLTHNKELTCFDKQMNKSKLDI